MARTYKNIDQGRLITNLNQYLEWNNLPIRMNKGGVCNGLATVYAKYVAEGKKDDFFEMLEYVSSGEAPPPELAGMLDHFIVEVVLAYRPDLFDKELNQITSMQALEINGHHLFSDFNLAMTASDKDWAEIIATIDLKNNETMRVTSVNHACAVTKDNGVYIVYDPNYPSGIKTFTNERLLINELHKNVFGYQKGPLGMMVQIIRGPENDTPRVYPKVIDIYEQYLTTENVNQTAAIHDGSVFNLITYAAVLDDEEAVTKLINFGAKQLLPTGKPPEPPRGLIDLAIDENCPKVLGRLLKAQIDKINGNSLQIFLSKALINGQQEVFNELIHFDEERKEFKGNKFTVYQQHLTSFRKDTIRPAALGGNSFILNKIIADLGLSDDEITKMILEKKITWNNNSPIPSDAINIAINQGSLECVNLLLKTINKPLNEEQQLDYLLQAIKKNNGPIVSSLLHYIGYSKEALKTIDLSLTAIEKTDLTILKNLKASGFEFSEKAEGIIKKKEHEPVGIMLTIGIMLKKFTEFCKEIFQKTENVSLNTEKFSQFKAKMQAGRVENVAREAPVVEPASNDTPSNSL